MSGGAGAVRGGVRLLLSQQGESYLATTEPVPRCSLTTTTTTTTTTQLRRPALTEMHCDEFTEGCFHYNAQVGNS